MVNRGRAIAALAQVARVGAHLAWLDTVWPMHRKSEWVTVGRIAIVRSTNHRVRLLSIFQRTAAHEALRAALAAQTAEVQALTVQLTEAREARQRERERHEAKMIEVMNERNEAREEHYREIIRLAACGVAAMQNTRETMKDRIGPDHPQYSASYGDVCRAVDREVELREQLQAAVTEARGQVIAEIAAELNEWLRTALIYQRERDSMNALIAKLATLDTRREGEE